MDWSHGLFSLIACSEARVPTSIHYSYSRLLLRFILSVNTHPHFVLELMDQVCPLTVKLRAPSAGGLFTPVIPFCSSFSSVEPFSRASTHSVYLLSFYISIFGHLFFVQIVISHRGQMVMPLLQIFFPHDRACARESRRHNTTVDVTNGECDFKLWSRFIYANWLDMSEDGWLSRRYGSC